MKNNESKYKQVVNFVIDGIAEGKLQKGDWIPSINEFRENYRLSRDTVFAGLSELKSRGIIASTPGVGYYIASARIPSEQNIFLLFNEFNEFKEDLYNSFMEHVGKGVSVDLYFHNYNRRVFDALVTDANGKYTTYIIMPGKFTGIAPLLESLSGRVFLLDHFHPELLGRYSSVAQNFEKDTYEALCHGLRHIRKYERLLMVQHDRDIPDRLSRAVTPDLRPQIPLERPDGQHPVFQPGKQGEHHQQHGCIEPFVARPPEPAPP